MNSLEQESLHSGLEYVIHIMSLFLDLLLSLQRETTVLQVREEKNP